MAVLSETDRQRAWRGFMRYLSAQLQSVPGCTKTDFRAAVDATDTYIDGIQTAYNNALPQPFRGAATTAQKTLLFCFVALMRVSPGMARMVLGEVD